MAQTAQVQRYESISKAIIADVTSTWVTLIEVQIADLTSVGLELRVSGSTLTTSGVGGLSKVVGHIHRNDELDELEATFNTVSTASSVGTFTQGNHWNLYMDTDAKSLKLDVRTVNAFPMYFAAKAELDISG